MTEVQIDAQRKRLRNTFLVAILILYFILLIWVIVFKCNDNASMHIEMNRAMTIRERLAYKAIPFKYTIERLKAGAPLETIATIFNVLIFAPMTMIFRYLKIKKLTAVLIAAAVSMAIEILQLFTGWGGYDISDWILNVLGALLGLAVFALFTRMSHKAQFVTVAICGFIALPVDIFAIINTVLNFPH